MQFQKRSVIDCFFVAMPQTASALRQGIGFRSVFAALTLALWTVSLFAPNTYAQGLDPAALLKPAPGTLPTYNADYSCGRCSTLDQVTAGDVGWLTSAAAGPNARH